jgi:transposase InsO family protein
LKDLWQKNYSVYGRRKLTKAARRQNLECGRDQVARLMKQQGIQGASRAKKRFTTHSDKDAVRAPDLVQRVSRHRSEPALGRGLHLLLHVVRSRLCGLHHRRVLATTGGLEGGALDDRGPRG